MLDGLDRIHIAVKDRLYVAPNQCLVCLVYRSDVTLFPLRARLTVAPADDSRVFFNVRIATFFKSLVLNIRQQCRQNKIGRCEPAGRYGPASSCERPCDPAWAQRRNRIPPPAQA